MSLRIDAYGADGADALMGVSGGTGLKTGAFGGRGGRQSGTFIVGPGTALAVGPGLRRNSAAAGPGQFGGGSGDGITGFYVADCGSPSGNDFERLCYECGGGRTYFAASGAGGGGSFVDGEVADTVVGQAPENQPVGRATFRLQADGNMVIRKADGSTIWQRSAAGSSTPHGTPDRDGAQRFAVQLLRANGCPVKLTPARPWAMRLRMLA